MYIGDLEHGHRQDPGGMEGRPLDDSFKIASPRAAAILQRPRSRQILLELVAREQSLAELASGTGLSLTLLHYHVNRMRELGLVAVAAVAGRSGRPVKRYRAVARAFLVPPDLSTDASGKALARELQIGLERDRARREDAGVTYFVDEAGRHRMTRAVGDARPSGLEVWASLSLTRSQTDDLARDVRALFAKYAAPPAGEARRIIAYCAFTERTP